MLAVARALIVGVLAGWQPGDAYVLAGVAVLVRLGRLLARLTHPKNSAEKT